MLITHSIHLKILNDIFESTHTLSPEANSRASKGLGRTSMIYPICFLRKLKQKVSFYLPSDSIPELRRGVFRALSARPRSADQSKKREASLLVLCIPYCFAANVIVVDRNAKFTKHPSQAVLTDISNSRRAAVVSD